MEAFIGLLVLVLLLVMIIVGPGVRVVPQARRDVVERFGRFRRLLGPGVNVIVPVVDRVRAKIDMREQLLACHPIPVINSEKHVVTVHMVVYYRVGDPATAYQVDNLPRTLEQAGVDAVREVVEPIELDRIPHSYFEINHSVGRQLDRAAGAWGVTVTRVDITDIELPPSAREPLQHRIRQLEQELSELRRAAGMSVDGSGPSTDDVSGVSDEREASG